MILQPNFPRPQAPVYILICLRLTDDYPNSEKRHI